MPTTYEPIATTTIAIATQYAEFISIPQTYTDLILVQNCKSSISTVNTALQVGNGSYDTATNYSWTFLGGSGSAASSSRGSNQTSIITGAVSTTNNTPVIVQFINYSNTTTNKTVISRGSGADFSSGQSVSAFVGLWRSTSAITRIRVSPSSQNWVAGSTFTLYGIKAA